MNNEFLLDDRLTKIRSVIEQYGEENFYISFSGGKDSTVLSYLIDLAIPGNKIPRVYSNTGIEYNEVVKFVKSKCDQDDRFIMLMNYTSIRQSLEEHGYPFKSKVHATYARRCRELGYTRGVKQYLGILEGKKPWSKQNSCPDKLRYQFFKNDMNFKISEKCCDILKKHPIEAWRKIYGYKYAITGIRQSEGGGRSGAQCVVIKGGTLKFFNPLAVMSDEWVEWFIKEYNIQLCKLYYAPYNFRRTGCKGCPFNRYLQKELDTLSEYFPTERKQCEIIWKPVYEEYRRIGYRLKKEGEQS